MTVRANSMPAPEKVTFLLSLVPYLIDAGSVSVGEAAEHFGVSPDTVRDAVRLIAVSGVPGETSQYQAEDLFDISWDDFEENDRIAITHHVALDDSPRFSAREASALIAGLQYLSALPENADREVIGSLMAKLTRGASSAPSEVAVAASAVDSALEATRGAVASATQLEFDYLNARGEHEHRIVDPLRIESVDQDWYLRAWCHLREAIRTFRIDRMTAARATSAAITPHGAEIALPEALFEVSADDLSVVVSLAESALPLISAYSPEKVGRATENGTITVNIRVAHYHGLKRLAGRFSGVLTVIAPPAARASVASWAAAGAAQYEEEQYEEDR